MGNLNQKPTNNDETAPNQGISSSDSRLHLKDASTCLLKLFEKLELTADEGNIHPGVLSRKAFENTFHGPIEIFGKLLYIQMQHGHTEKDRITKEQFVKAGKEILKMNDDNDQKKYYFKLFAAGKNFLTKDDSKNLASICYALTLSLSSIPYSHFENDERIFDAMVDSMYGIREKLADLEFMNWMEKHCPHLFCSVHEWVVSILTGTKSHMEEVSTPVPELDHILKGHYLINKTILWCMSISLPGIYLTIPSKSAMVSRSSSNPLISSCVQDLIMKARLPHCQIWNLIYSSNDHGLSMNRFSYHVSSYNGPCVTLFYFEGRNLYCFASDCGWRVSTKRYGGDQCLLIQFYPIYRIVQAGPNICLWNEHNREFAKGIQIGQDPSSVILDISSEFDSIKHYGVACGLYRIEVWGCGGSSALEAQVKQKQWEAKEVQKHQGRKLNLYQKTETWEENPDKQLLEWGGVRTNHSNR